MERDPVSLVIPGRNSARTIGACLTAALAVQNRPASRLAEIIFVDDGSTDDTADIVRRHPVRCLSGPSGGPGAARNVGWRAATSALVWFIDSDCVASPDALELLLPHMNDPAVAGVGGSYANMCPDSRLASIIHEEIIARHAAMPMEVNFLGGFNVVYRRRVLEEVGGFDETAFNGPGSPGAEDAELAYRIHAAGHRLRFEPKSLVGHYHPTQLRRYLRAQRHHGYWRVNLHLRHKDKAGGDAYSGILDHCQPPLAMLILVSLPLLLASHYRWIPACLTGLLLLAQIPLTWRLVRRSGKPAYVGFAWISFVRAFARGLGMTCATLLHITAWARPQRTDNGRLRRVAGDEGIAK